MTRLATLSMATFVLAFAGCGGDDSSESESTGTAGAAGAATATETPEPAAAKGTTVQVADSDYGQILFDDSDQAIYLFEKESGSKSECYGACAEAWPPVLTQDQPQAGSGADAALLGTTQRDDGSTQVTYNGHPLYYYVDDPKGEVLCHDVEEFGGLWLVVDSAGNPV